MGRFLVRHGGVAGVALALVVGWTGPAVAGEPRSELIRRTHDLIERQGKCEASVRTAQQRRYEASQKPYLSDQDRQKDWQRLDRAVEAEQVCVAKATAELQQSLAALEIQSQKDVDEARARLAQAAVTERPGLEKTRSEATTAVNWARFQRLQREQLERLKTRELDCEQGAKNTADFIKSNVLRPSYTDSGARTYRDQQADAAMFEQEQRNFQACADNARQQQAQIRVALGGRASAGTPESRVAFERDVQALLRALQQIAAQLDDRTAIRYDEFTARMTRLSRDLEAFKTRYAQILANQQGQPLAGQLVQAAELVVTSAATWQRAGGMKDTAQRDATLREVGVQWQRFQNLVRETSDLAAKAGREESGQASPAGR